VLEKILQGLVEGFHVDRLAGKGMREGMARPGIPQGPMEGKLANFEMRALFPDLT
jgi:hypothetical protein